MADNTWLADTNARSAAAADTAMTIRAIQSGASVKQALAANVVSLLQASAYSAILSLLGTGGPLVVPEGRLTLTSNTAVTNADVTGSAAIYYTPYTGNRIPTYDGTKWSAQIFTELSNDTTASSTGSAGPAAVANNSVYDLFVWSDGGTIRLTRGPAWTNDTTRSSGLTLTHGVYLNTSAITNGPAALRGTYVGTVRSNGSAQIVDSRLRRLCWNMYNRRVRFCEVKESADEWAYTLAVIRQANGNAANQFDYVCGVAEDAVVADVNTDVYNDNAAGVLFAVGIGVDSTTAFSGIHPMRQNIAASRRTSATGSYRGIPGLGYHFLAWLEYSGAGTGSTTWGGDHGNATLYESGMTGRVMA
jgi:hypothetical protein